MLLNAIELKLKVLEVLCYFLLKTAFICVVSVFDQNYTLALIELQRLEWK